LLVFALLITFFPGLQAHQIALLIIILLLAISFLGFSVLTFNRENSILRIGYILSSVWLVISFYFVASSLIVLILYLLYPVNISNYGLAAMFISAALTAYGLINARITRVTKITVPLPNLPDFWKGKTAVMVSDLHLGEVLKNGFAKKIINLINRQSPEIVFIPGDFYDGTHTRFKSYAGEFKKINAPSGIYFCSGNHEMFAGYKKCEQALRDTGIKILENQIVEVQGLQIAGVAYKHDTMPDLAQTLGNLNLDKNKPGILLKHVPLQLKEVEEAGFNLVLCGHSHHGQIWPGRHITKRYFKGFDYGLKTFKNLLVYTSSGAGTWGPPLRVFSRSEIVKIIFE
jgi:predicted MPP superfamily phosphohydrolase